MAGERESQHHVQPLEGAFCFMFLLEEREFEGRGGGTLAAQKPLWRTRLLGTAPCTYKAGEITTPFTADHAQAQRGGVICLGVHS